MKKLVWLAVVIIAIYLIGLQMANNESPAQAMDVPSRPAATATIQPTQTPVPTATTGYELTAIVAQATADEARRINAQATADHELVQLGLSQLTAQAEDRAMAQLQLTAAWEGITATVAYTSIPLTATQQAALNTQIPARQILEAGQLTATHEAPTQIVAMERSLLYAKYGKADYFFRWFGIFMVGIFVIGIVRFMFRYPIQPKPETEPKDEPTETVIWLKNEKDNGATSKRYAVPCTPEQLTELSELVINGEKTFGINRLENSSRTLRRSTLYQVREFLTLNLFAVDAGAGQIALNEDGEEFLAAWFEEHKLPGGYDFAEQEKQVVDG
jgi:hypothetical protein